SGDIAPFGPASEAIAPGAGDATDDNVLPPIQAPAFSAPGVRKTLDAAQVKLDSDVIVYADNNGEDISFRWLSGKPEGEAKHHDVTQDEDYNRIVQEYIQAFSQTCSKDMQVNPVFSYKVDGKEGEKPAMETSSYSFSCPAYTEGVLFYRVGGDLMVYTHKADA